MKRVVITGIGVISPIGIGRELFWDSLINGRCGIEKIQSFDSTQFRTNKGGEVKDFNPEDFIDKRKIKHMGRSSQFAISATKLAIKDAGLNLNRINPERIGVSMGTTMGEPQIMEEVYKKWFCKGLDSVPHRLFYQYPCGMISSNIGLEFGFEGPNLIIPTACAAGNYAIGYAFDLLRLNKVDVMIAGGSDPLSQIAFTGFNRLFSIAQDLCQPFDKNRTGLIIGEGAGILILETLEHARRRKAPIQAEILGYGLSCSAYHMTQPHPQAVGAVNAMKKALSEAKVSIDSIDYICAHGTGTLSNDKSETIAIKKVFGSSAYKIPISSIKSMLGHTMGAASAIEAIACVLSVNSDIIPPTINYFEQDPDCDLDYVPNIARKTKTNIALSNAYAFGGNDSSILIRNFSNN